VTDACDKTRQKFSACQPFADGVVNTKKDKRKKFTFKIVREKTQAVRFVKIHKSG
jgi:hypothetical protein